VNSFKGGGKEFRQGPNLERQRDGVGESPRFLNHKGEAEGDTPLGAASRSTSVLKFARDREVAARTTRVYLLQKREPMAGLEKKAR